MATMLANGGVVVFTARKFALRLYDFNLEVRVMANGAGLSPRYLAPGKFKKVRSVAKSRNQTFVEIATEFEDAGWSIDWTDKGSRLAETKPKKVTRRRFPHAQARPPRRVVPFMGFNPYNLEPDK